MKCMQAGSRELCERMYSFCMVSGSQRGVKNSKTKKLRMSFDRRAECSCYFEVIKIVFESWWSSDEFTVLTYPCFKNNFIFTSPSHTVQNWFHMQFTHLFLVYFREAMGAPLFKGDCSFSEHIFSFLFERFTSQHPRENFSSSPHWIKVENEIRAVSVPWKRQQQSQATYELLSRQVGKDCRCERNQEHFG